jgi:hypothetical protein
MPAGGIATGRKPSFEAIGGLWMTVYGSLEDAYQASLIGLAELGYTVVQEAKTEFGAHVVAVDPRGRNVAVDMSAEAENATRIGVRVGAPRDKRPEIILSRIRHNL